MKVYISGKISGDENYKAKFESAEKDLVRFGYDVVNPAKVHIEDGTWEEYMKADIKLLLECDEVYLLSDWVYSRGARLEARIAEEVGIKVRYQ